MPPPELLGPRSLHWRYAGDNRVMLLQVKAALLQLMHPALGAGVQQHSRFYNDSFTGLSAAVPAIQGMTYDWPDAGITAREIRGRHLAVKGRDAHGQRYHALDPETYFWGHATMFDMMVTAIDIFDHPLTEAEKQRLYRESMASYALYGVSLRTVPTDWPAFADYFDGICTDVLELTPAASAMLRFQGDPPALAGGIPGPVYALVKGRLGRLMWWAGLGTLHPAVQRRIGFAWTSQDQRRLGRLGALVSAGWPVLPRRLRYSKRAQAGLLRAREHPA